MVSKLFCGQISWNSNDWIVRNRQVSAKAIGLNFSSNCPCTAFYWVPRAVAQAHFVRKQTISKPVNTRFSPESRGKKLCRHVFFAFCAGFYTTALTARKLCSATLRQFIVWILCRETFASKKFSFLKNADYIPEMLGNQPSKYSWFPSKKKGTCVILQSKYSFIFWISKQLN